MGRPLRVIQNIYPYHLTCRTNNRTFRFNQRQVTRIFFQALKETQKKYSFLIHHVLVMSDYYHIVATATEENLHRFMSRLWRDPVQQTGRTLRTLPRRVSLARDPELVEGLWGGRYGSCIIDTDEYYLASVRYIPSTSLGA